MCTCIYDGTSAASMSMWSKALTEKMIFSPPPGMDLQYWTDRGRNDDWEAFQLKNIYFCHLDSDEMSDNLVDLISIDAQKQVSTG